MKQNTIKKPVTIEGAGLHTGKIVKMTFNPAEAGTGIVFQRIDLPEAPKVKALVQNVVDTSRGTTIEEKGVKIMTIEHTLAALTGMGIDNVLIEIDGEEVPIIDGSSKLHTDLLTEAGIEPLDADRECIEIDTVITYTDKEKNIELMAIPSDSFKLSVLVDYESEVLKSQFAELNSINDFQSEIAPSRTFVFVHELEYLLDNDLIKGGDVSNAIVFVDKPISDDTLAKLAKVFNRPDVKVLQQGILDNVELSYQNEPARHKLLDLIGDLTLLGAPLQAHVIAKRPGHHANTQFAALISKYYREKTSKSGAPNVDLNGEPLFNIQQIMNILPHRPPFLLVDKILEMSDTHVVGMKNITMNEPFFVGHFPAEPVMPGVLQIEALAQVGGILALSTVSDPENYLTYFLKVDNVKWRSKVVPGDTLVFKNVLLEPIRRGICQMQGEIYVGDKLVMEATMMAQIVKQQ